MSSVASNEFAASDQEYALTVSLVGQQTLRNINGALSIEICFLKDGYHSEWAVTISEEAKCPVAAMNTELPSSWTELQNCSSNSYSAEGGLSLGWWFKLILRYRN